MRDLGLVARDAPLRVANPIYAEVWRGWRSAGCVAAALLRTDGSGRGVADGGVPGFFRRHSEHWRNRFAYEEAWPQLLLQAYLQRVVNGGGRIEREYALGAGGWTC